MFSFALEHRPPESPGVSNMQWWYSLSCTFLESAWLLLLKGWRNSRANFQKEFFSFLCTTPNNRGLHWNMYWKREGLLYNHLSFPEDSFFCLLHASIGLQLALGCAPREAFCSGCWGDAGNLLRSPFIHTLPCIFPPVSETANSRSQICHLKRHFYLGNLLM